MTCVFSVPLSSLVVVFARERRERMQQAHTGPTTLDKLKMGAMMGTSVGLVVGLVFGGYNILKYGPGPSGFTRTLGKTMLGSAATFGFFMAIGTTIRTEGFKVKQPAMYTV